jgi:hypothetical protein
MGNRDSEEEGKLNTLINEFKTACLNTPLKGLGAYSRTIKVHDCVEKITGMLKEMEGTRDIESRLNSKLATIEKLHLAGLGPFRSGWDLVEIVQIGAKWMSIYKFIRDGTEDSLKTKWD